MDFKSPIDITAVMTAVKKHKDLLVAIDKLDASELFQHFTPMPGIIDSIELGKVEGGEISGKYMGVFLGDKKLGKIVPRRLIVRPVVMEMADEPERYRRSYIADIPGEITKRHPFELWIINHGHTIASEELLNAIFVARYDSSADKKSIRDSFDGLGTIFVGERVSGAVSVANGNMFETGEIARKNIGERLLAMYRSMPDTFKRKKSKMFISTTLGETYDDWRKDEGQVIIGQTEETTGTKYLLGSNGKCELVRVPCLPENSQFVFLTTRQNVIYGFDKASDFKSIRPFNSGNPYLFTAAGKYVIGFQVISIHKTEFCMNELPLDPAAANTLGTLKVTITPTEVLPDGAVWRVKGEDAWRKSGDMATLAPGQVEIEYNDVAGYSKPSTDALTKATITAGTAKEITAAYKAVAG